MIKLKNPARTVILNEIFECLQQITQWIPNNLELSLKYFYKAEGLIEFLENLDCDSIGGHDTNSPNLDVTSCLLYNRFLTLVRKYKNEGDIKEVCEFTLTSLGTYFTKVEALRGKI